MTDYVNESEVQSLWKSRVKAMIGECKSQRKVPEGLVKLIKHNFYAKYVSYNSTRENIEIGVNESKQVTTTYTTLKVYRFPLNEIEDKLVASSQSTRGDLEFYAKVLKGIKLDDKLFIV